MRKIIDSLKDAVAGNFARVTIEGQTWVRKEELIAPQWQVDHLRAENEASLERLTAKAAVAHHENMRLRAEIAEMRALLIEVRLRKDQFPSWIHDQIDAVLAKTAIENPCAGAKPTLAPSTKPADFEAADLIDDRAQCLVLAGAIGACALRPLGRRIPSKLQFALDEEATAVWAAEQGRARSAIHGAMTRTATMQGALRRLTPGTGGPAKIWISASDLDLADRRMTTQQSTTNRHEAAILDITPISPADRLR